MLYDKAYNGKPTLVRTDKNGTEYWEDCTCERCGGYGVIHGYEHVEGGICFECGGMGYSKRRTWKVYTDEYAEKLRERREERNRKEAPEKNKALFGRMGLATDGSAYIVMGETYERRNELKEAGAHFHPAIGWYFAEQVEDFDVQKFPVEDFGLQDEFGKWHFDKECLSEKIRKAQEEYAGGKSASDFVGEIGEKIAIQVTVERIACFDTQWGTTSVFTFADADGNIFVWKTTAASFEKGEHVQLCGKIKEHSKYKGIKQTVLTRCKVKEV